MKSKHFHKGILQLVQEGAIQYYKTYRRRNILGAVGQLQFEVFEHRMNNEYNVERCEWNQLVAKLHVGLKEIKWMKIYIAQEVCS